MNKEVPVNINLMSPKGILSVIFFFLCMFLYGQIDVEINSGNPRIPFPQFTDYAHGKTLGRDNAEGVTDIEMERDIREAYQIMMNRAQYTGEEVAGTKYIVYNPAGHGFTGPEPDVTEGDGYALLAMAYMADKAAFDGLFMYVHDYKTSVVEYFNNCGVIRNPNYPYGPGTIGWKPGEDDGAADGDFDIAMATLIAYYQWPNGGIEDDCGVIRSYKSLAEETMKAISDTVFFDGGGCPWACGGNSARDDISGSSGFYSGHIGFDGYIKSGNTWGQLTPFGWGTNGNNPAGGYDWNGVTFHDRSSTFAQKSFHCDYAAPAWFNAFYNFLEDEDPALFDWNIHQFKRAEASSDWMMGQVVVQGIYPTAGNYTMSGTTPQFTEMNFAEDSRHPWRTILNYTWHGNPNTRWDENNNEVVAGGNTYEFDNAIRMAELVKFENICAKLGNDPTALQFNGPAVMTDNIGLDGSVSPGVGKHINYNLGSVAPSIVTYHDENNNEESKKLLAEWYRQSNLMWDATDEGLPYPESRYITSLPKYFHGWFRLLGMLVTTGNYQSPSYMKQTILPANVKVYKDVDKTLAFGPTFEGGRLITQGDLINYTFSYRNFSSTEAENVQIVFPVPNEVEVAGIGNGGSVVGNTVVWDIGNIPGYVSTGESAADWENFDPTGYNTFGEVTLQVRVKNGVGGTMICEQPTITANNSDSYTSNEFPNNYTSTMERNCVDLRERSLKIEKTSDKTLLKDGEFVNFNIDFENSSDAGFLSGGRSGVRVTYGNGTAGPNTLINYFRFLHGAEESYVNPGNYRISYYLNDAARLGLYDAVTNPDGWKLTNTITGEGGSMTFDSEVYTPGEDAIGKWNQRLIMRFPDTLMSTTQHTNMFFAKAGEPNDVLFVHKGIASPFRTAVQMEAVGGASGGCTLPVADVVFDDWSYTNTVDVGSNDKSLYSPITPSWFDPQSTYNDALAVPITDFHPNACTPSVTTTFDRMMVEEWDGYVWRRVLGRGPVAGIEIENVCIYDTLPEGLEFVEFTDDEAVNVKATYNPVTRVISWCVPRLLPGAIGDFSYRAQAVSDCIGNKLASNKAWIQSNSSSPISAEQQVIITCEDITPRLTLGSTMYKTADRDVTDVNETIKYEVSFVQSDGTIATPDLSTTSDWEASCGMTFGPFSAPLMGNISSSTLVTYDYSHGTNGEVEATVEFPEAGGFSLAFRYDRVTGGSPECGAYKGIFLSFSRTNCGQLDLELYQDGVLIDNLDDQSFKSPVDILDVTARLEGNQISVWVNNDNALPFVLGNITLPASGADPGYVGFFNNRADGQMRNEGAVLSSWETNFDSGFDVNLTDRLPSEITIDQGSLTVEENTNSNGGTYSEPLVYNSVGNEVTWVLVQDKEPMLFGDSVAFSFSANVDDCGNGEITNVAFASMLGQPDFFIGDQVITPCGEPEVCPLQSIAIDQSPLLTIPVFGSGSLSATLDSDDAGVGYRYTWYKDGIIYFEGLDLQLVTVNEAGNYTLVVTDLLDTTCSVTSDVATVTISGTAIPPIANFTADILEICAGEAVLFTDASSGTISTYTWDFEDGTSSSSGGVGPHAVTFNSPGVKEISLTVSGPDGSDTEIKTTYITVSQTPSIDVSDTSICSPGTIDFTTGLWSDLNSLTGTIVTYHNALPTSSANEVLDATAIGTDGTYYIKSDNSGCIDEEPVIVTVHDLPSATLSSDLTLCKEDVGTASLDVTPSGGSSPYTVSYTYDDGTNVTNATLSITGSLGSIDNTVGGTDLGEGTYTLTEIEDANGCIGTLTDESDVDVHTDLVVTPTSSCDVLTQEATITATISDGEPAYQLISENPGTAGTVTGSNYSSTFVADSSTSYDFTIADNSGCTDNTVVVSDVIDCSCGIEGTISIATGSNDTICTGETVTLEVTATGSINGAGAVYTIILTDGTTDYSSTGLVDGKYQFEVSNSGTYSIDSISDGNCDGIGLNTIDIVEETLPQFTLDLIGNPEDLCPNETLNLQVTATGTDISFQWQKDGTNLPGKTNNGISKTVIDQATDGGIYTLNAMGSCDTITSTAVEVTIGDSTRLLTNLNTTQIDLCPTEPLNLEVEASGTGTLTYAWTTPGGITSTTDQLNSTSVVFADSGAYSVEVTGTCNSVTSLVTPVNVRPSVSITSQPGLMDPDLCPNENFTLTVGSSGSNLTYQWLKDGLNILGEVSASFSGTAATAADAGVYSVIVTGDCGSDTSGNVIITVGNSTVIDTEPQDATACALSNASFGVTASGDNLTYQWFKDNSPLANDTNSTLAINPTNVSDEGTYRVQVSGACGTLSSADASLSITTTETPTVNLGSDKGEICEGDDVTFTAVGGATGTNPVYVFKDALGNELQAGPSNTYTTTGGILNDLTVEVGMISTSSCLDPAASDTIFDQVVVTTVDSATVEITSPNTPNHVVASDELNLTSTSNYSVTWSKPNLSQQGNIVSSNSNTTNLTGLTVIDGITNIIVTAQDPGGVCPEVTDEIEIERKDVTIPDLPDGTTCITDLPYSVIGNAIIPIIETPLIIDQDGAIGGGSVSATSVDITTAPTFTGDSQDFVFTYEIANSASGGTLSDIGTVTIYNEPTIAYAGTDVITCADQINLNADVVTIGTGEWTCDAGLLTNENDPGTLLGGLPDGITTCIWRTSNGLCTASTDTVIITKSGDITAPKIFVDGSEVTGGSIDICLTDNKTLSGSIPVSPETSNWSITSGTSITGVSGNASDQGIMTIAEAGQTVIEYTITSTTPGCLPETKQINITVHEAPVADITSITSNDTCAGIDIDLTTSPIGITDMISWEGTPVPTSLGTDDNWQVSKDDLSIGSNTIQLKVENLGCGSDTDTEIINIESIEPVDIFLNEITIECVGNDVLYTAFPSGGGATPSYVWSYSQDPSITGSTASNSLTLNNVQESVGTITVEMTSSERCPDKQTVSTSTTLEVVPGPTPMILTGDTVLCVNDAPLTLIAAETSGQFATLQWYRDDIIPVGTPNSLTLADVTESGTYTFVANNGGCTRSDMVTVDIRQIPEVDASANGIDPIFAAFDDPDLQLFGNTDSIGTTYEWTVDNPDLKILNTGYLITPIETEKGGLYTATLTVTDGPCTNYDEVLLVLSTPLHAPNVFTPNGDGDHETFTIDGIETYPDAKVLIYNRWGIMVYETKDYPSHEWDADGIPDGVYFYIVKLNGGLDIGSDASHTGVIHVIR